MENPYATYRNGHQLFNTFNPEDNTLDIRSNALWPANVLSNLWEKPFVFEDVECGSMEGFLQSLKYPESEKQKTVCILYGNRAKNAGKLKDKKKAWFHKQLLYWKDIAIPRQSQEYLDLLRKAYRACFEQNELFRIALAETKGKTLTHRSGCPDPTKTILTEEEFKMILTELRDSMSNE